VSTLGQPNAYAWAMPPNSWTSAETLFEDLLALELEEIQSMDFDVPHWR
jgi:hypothetical protein